MPLLRQGVSVRQGYVVGDKRYGAPGGYPDSAHMLLSAAVVDRLSARMGCPVPEAERFLRAFGQVAQDMLLNGEPVGIPFLGVLNVRQVAKRLVAANLNRHGQGPPHSSQRTLRGSDGNRYMVRYVNWWQPRSLRKLFHDNALYTGSLADHVASARGRRDASRKR